MLTRQEIKQRTKEQIRGNIGISFLCRFLYYVSGYAITFALIFAPFVISISGLFLLTPPLILGLKKVYLEMSYNRKPEVSVLFSGFNQYGQTILTYLLLLVPIIVFYVLILVPLLVIIFTSRPIISMMYGMTDMYHYANNGLILWFIWCIFVYIFFLYVLLGFSMTFYIMAEQPDLSAVDVLKASWQMMKGRRWNYIIFHLSFLLWHLLGIFTLGIAYIYVTPYLMTADANYYHNIKANQNLFPVGWEEPADQSPVSKEAPVMNVVPTMVETPVEHTAPVMNETLTENIPQASNEDTPLVMTETPREHTAPVLTETPVENRTPVLAEASSEDTPPTVVEASSENIPPAAAEAPAESTSPAVLEVPGENISSSVIEAPTENIPSVTENAPVAETSALEETSPVAETPAESVPPVFIEAPAFEKIPETEEAPANEEISTTEEAPASNTASVAEKAPLDEAEGDEEWSWEKAIKK